MKDTVRTLNKLLKEKGASENTEVTRCKGEYRLLHICRNGVPVPTIISEDTQDIRDEIELRY